MEIVNISDMDDFNIMMENINDTEVNISKEDINNESIRIIKNDSIINENIIVKSGVEFVGIGVLSDDNAELVSETVALDPNNDFNVGDTIVEYRLINRIDFIKENLSSSSGEDGFNYFLENININTHIVAGASVFDEYAILEDMLDNIKYLNEEKTNNIDNLYIINLDDSLSIKPMIHKPNLKYNDGKYISFNENIIDKAAKLLLKHHSLTECKIYKIPLTVLDKSFIKENIGKLGVGEMISNLSAIINNEQISVITENLYSYIFDNNPKILGGMDFNDPYKKYSFRSVSGAMIPVLAGVENE